MLAELTNIWEWPQYFSDEKSCPHISIKLRQSEKFRAAHIDHQNGYLLNPRYIFIENAGFQYHTLFTTVTLFHDTNPTLVQTVLLQQLYVILQKQFISIRVTNLIAVSELLDH